MLSSPKRSSHSLESAIPLLSRAHRQGWGVTAGCRHCRLASARRRRGLPAKGTIQARAARKDNALVNFGVGAVTSILRLFQGPRALPQEGTTRHQRETRAKGLSEVLGFIREDYENYAYFVTGDIHDGIYSEDCYFADPTVRFSGLQKWKRNLQLLVPFLEQPKIALKSLESVSTSPLQIKATWRLTTQLKLPWRPCIDVSGSTDYLLNSSETQIVRHVESWEVSGMQAIAQIFRPSHVRE